MAGIGPIANSSRECWLNRGGSNEVVEITGQAAQSVCTASVATYQLESINASWSASSPRVSNSRCRISSGRYNSINRGVFEANTPRFTGGYVILDNNVPYGTAPRGVRSSLP